MMFVLAEEDETKGESESKSCEPQKAKQKTKKENLLHAQDDEESFS